MKEELESVLNEARQLKERIRSLIELESFRVKFLGRRGIIRGYLKQILQLGEREKRELGKYLNRIKKEIEAIAQELELKLRRQDKVVFDFRHPGRPPLIGHPHPLSRSLRQIQKIFISLGFSVIETPEIVTEEENFDSLNIPPNHPARDIWDTLWINSKSEIRNSNLKPRYLFRTHTSSYQVSFIKTHQPPFRIIMPGKVFRHEAIDRTHDFEFHQLEGLAITVEANLAQLKGVCESFLSQFFGQSLAVRFRTSFFPFTEPSLEVDVECVMCQGSGCLVCRNSGFIEIGGAGMVHPYVLKQGGLNANQYSGYAFGLGIERLIMLKYKIDDIRLFHSGDLRFIRQF